MPRHEGDSGGVAAGHDYSCATILGSSLLLGLRCNARDSRLYPEGFKRGDFELSGGDAESWQRSVKSGWGQSGLPGWGSVVDNTEMKGPIDLEELVFPSDPHFGGNSK